MRLIDPIELKRAISVAAMSNNHKTLEQIIDEQPSAQPEIIRCKECKHFHYDMPYVIQGVPVLGHEVCDFWGDGCKTSENGFCSYAERKGEQP